MMAKGQTGQRHWNCRLTESDVQDILYAYYIEHVPFDDLCREYSYKEIWMDRLLMGLTWTEQFNIFVRAFELNKDDLLYY